VQLRRDRLAIAAAALLLVGLIAGFWIFRIVLGGSRFPGWGDPLTYYYPHYMATGAMLAQGSLPIWNPYQLCGIPWLAALQGGVLYPPHLLYALLPTHLGMAVSSLLHLLLVGGAVAVFARRVGLGWSAVLLAAALCAMRGRIAGLSAVPNMMEAGAWLAPGAVAVLGLARGRGTRSVALLAVSTAASVLAGYPQYSVYICYAWTVLLGALLLGERPPLAGWLRAGGGLLGGVALGALLAGVQLLPALEMSGLGTRSLGSLSMGAMLPFGLKGGSRAGVALELLSGKGEGHLPLSLGYVGLALVPFALLNRHHRALALGTIGLGLLVLSFAMGPATPLFDFYLQLPALGSFRIPSRILFVLDFCFAVAAALGLDEIRRRASRLAGGSLRLGNTLAAGIVVLALVELFAANPERPRLPYFREGYVQVFERDQAIYSVIAASPQRVFFWNPGFAPRLPSKLASVFGMRAVDDYEPMSLRRQAEYFGFLQSGSTRSKRHGSPFYGRLSFPRTPEQGVELASRQRLFDLAATRFMLAPAGLARSPELLAYANAAGLERRPGPNKALVVLENPRALPRAYVTYRVRPAPPAEELLAVLSRSGFDPLAESYLEGVPGLLAVSGAPLRGRPAAIVRDEPRLVEVEAELEAPGLLVLADSYFPGWQATVDGEPVEIQPANHLFRGVVLPAGQHRVRFAYRPRSLMLGIAASGLGAAVLLVLGWPATTSPSGRRPGSARPESERTLPPPHDLEGKPPPDISTLR